MAQASSGVILTDIIADYFSLDATGIGRPIVAGDNLVVGYKIGDRGPGGGIVFSTTETTVTGKPYLEVSDVLTDGSDIDENTLGMLPWL